MSIADARYVSFTTFRRSGEPVPVAVWIAPLADGRLGFTTDAASGKAKRLGNDPRITLRPCDVRGKVADDAPEVTGTAAVVPEGPDRDAVAAAVGRKYGIQYRLVEVGGRLKRLIGRSSVPAAAIVITLD